MFEWKEQITGRKCNPFYQNQKFSKTERDKDRTDEIETQLTDCLKRLQKDGVISECDLERLRPVGTHIPRLYGLPKIHKDGVPVRPILDMRNLPYHTIAKWLADKLKPIQCQIAPHSLRDTFEFVDGVKDLDLNGRMMFTLDVSSLFTNVPVAETVDYICEFSTLSKQDIGMLVTALEELLLKCTLNVQFLFDNNLYRQLDGVAMGSPLGPLLANIFMGKLEATQLSHQINSLTYYKRYVDDIFAVASDQANLSTLMHAVNPSIKCTLEEKSGSLPFLGVLLS